MMFKNYIFDLDGTLLDTLVDITNAINYAMEKMGYPIHTKDEVRGYIGDGKKVMIMRAVPKNADEEAMEKVNQLYTEYYRAHLSDFTMPYDGIIDVLDELKSRGCTLAVVSNKTDINAKNVVKTFFGDRFDMVVGKMDCFPTKPAPDSVFYAMETLGIDKESTVYVGDSDVDVMTAHNAGLPCISVTWGNCDRSELLSTETDYIADVPSDILSVKI